MQAVKKTAAIHQIRQSEAKAQDSGFNIITKYFTDTTKNYSVKVNRSKSGDSAVKNATGHMRSNKYEALVCEVWDELLQEVLTVIVRDVTGAIYVMDYYDTVTGEKIQEQPWKKKLNKLFPNIFIRNDDGTERQLSLDEFRAIYLAMQPKG